MSRLCELTDLTDRLYSHSPTREFLSGICNIWHQSELATKTFFFCYFDMRRGCSDGFKTFGRTAGSSIAFHILKELSHSNGSSEALRWLPPKGGRLCRPLPRRGGRASISAALEDTTVALLAGSTLAISETSNPSTTLWTTLVSVCCQAPLSPSVWRLQTQTRGNYGAFRCFSVPLSSNACNIMCSQGYHLLLNTAAEIQHPAHVMLT